MTNYTNTSVSMRHVRKTFPGVVANDDVSIDFKGGEVHALLGENGAGKSTLMNILTGIYQQDSGQVLLDGKPIVLKDASEAIAAGIGMVHQHFKLVRPFTVAENIFIGWDAAPFFAHRDDLIRRAGELISQFGLEVNPAAYVDDLSAGQQQRVEIIRVLARGAKVLILDEPTAVLTPLEVATFFETVRLLKSTGRAIIFISHKLDEVLDISDVVTILRGGRTVATYPTAQMDAVGLANLMVGRDVVFDRLPRQAKTANASVPALRLQGVCTENQAHRRGLQDIDLSIQPNEIHGIAGVAGNGQRQLSEVITGLLNTSAGHVEIAGIDVADQDAGEIAELGVGHIPDDRLKHGFAGELPVYRNAILRFYKKEPIAKWPWFSVTEAKNLARRIVEAASVFPNDVDIPLRNLSGGNQQRLIAKRECDIATKLLIAVYPMRGLDVGAIERLREMIMERREAGAGVLLISEELDELLEMSDRISVLHHGRVVGTIAAEGATKEAIGLMMGGQRAHSTAEPETS